ncbi:DUF2267 domain-containing protein [Arenibaculum pallidiluteum]|uniref:DUF2267 domain-containing protein n=1 Tax=Arenibaculum pallidiluteum TaxID=2812559 RepID=UPI001A973518|nr:DUF2267 domain-containing protein [Arenibaculum pallidiluteum]
MTVPMEIQHASEDFDRFLVDVVEAAHLTTRNQAYTVVQGVLLVFRRRLAVREANLFANVLPPVLRAIFVSDWNVDEPRLPFGDRAAMTMEVQVLRRHHNFAPDTCIRNVATALRKHVDTVVLDRVLSELPEGAAEYWADLQ